MDPQATAHLDPKLKEAYDRVMATAVPQPSPASPPPLQPQAEPASPSTSPIQGGPVSTQTIDPQPLPSSAPIASAKPASAFVAVATKPKTKILPVLFVVGGLIFFVVYAVFWVKFFNLKLPFLPF